MIDALKRAFQRPAEKPVETDAGTPTTAEKGWSYDSLIYGGSDFSPYNPDELIAQKGYNIYRKMMRDEQVKAAARFKRNAVTSRGYYFDVKTDENGEEDETHVEIKEFFETVIDRIKGSWKDAMSNILTALQNGYSVNEKIYESFDYDGTPKWGIKRIRLLPYQTFDQGFDVDIHGNVLAVNQIVGADKNEIPLDKVVYFVHQPDIDPIYGESDLRAAYRAWWSKDIIIKFQNIHLERHAGGFIWASIKGSALGGDQSRRTNLQNILKNITAKTSIAVPEDVTLNFQNPVSTEAFQKAIAMYDRQIARSMLVPNMLGLTEQQEVGAYAQSQTHYEVFFWVLDEIAARLEDCLNEQLFYQLAVWNFGTEDYPKFKFEPMSDSQKVEMAKAWADLVQKGAVTKSDSDEAHTRRLMDYPEKVEEEEPEPEEELPPDDLFPDDTRPDEEGDISDGLDGIEREQRNRAWISSLPDDHRDAVRLEFIERPWLKRVDFQRISSRLDREDKMFLDELTDTMAKARFSIENQIAKIAGNRSFGNISPTEIDGDNAVRIPKSLKSKIAKLSRTSLQRSLDEHYELAAKEIPKKRMAANPIAPGMDKTKADRFLSSRAMTIAGVLDRDVLEAVQNLLSNAIKYDWSLRTVMQKLREDAKLMAVLPDYDAAGRAVNIPARLENIARTNTAEAMNSARNALFTSNELRGFVQAFEYSAILDARTTEVCASLHGKVRRDWQEYAPPNHYQCRSLLVPVTTVDDWDGNESRIPASVGPHEGFG